MRTKTKSLFIYLSFFLSGIVFAFLAAGVGYILNEIYFGTPIQTIYGKGHYATLRRNFGIADYTVSVEVDGEKVYSSGDIWGISERQLRATLVWDKSGNTVAFEKMGKIVFSYDANEKRLIQNEEIDSFCFAPMPSEYEEKHVKICEPYKNKFGYW